MGRSRDEVAAVLGQVLGGSVRDLKRLSGGASRITSSFDLETDNGSIRPLILQEERDHGLVPGGRVPIEAKLLRAANDVGVPVPHIVAAGAEGGLDPGWMVVERIEGETIPRKLLRDPEWAAARSALTDQCGSALAAIHRIDPDAVPGIPRRDPLSDPLPFLDGVREVRPCIELGVRWLDVHRPTSDRWVTVHGDFRLGNLLVGPHGLRAVLDWELAHAGDPAEDIGWLCARSWRFGGPGRVGGFGDLPRLLDAYRTAGGETIDPGRVQWWEVYAAVKWAVICALQTANHLGGATRSVELAAIGRRVCESEWDLLLLLDLTPADAEAPFADPAPLPIVEPFGRPTALELVEAVREHLEATTSEGRGGPAAFDDRVARNALLIVEREFRLGPSIARAHADRLANLGFDGDSALASTIRSGTFDDTLDTIGRALAPSIRDQLRVANPSHLDSPEA